MKTTKLSVEAAKDEISKVPERKAGQWTKICEEVKKTGQPVKVSEITRGQCWALRRTSREAGLESRVVDKGTAVIVMPPEKAPKVK